MGLSDSPAPNGRLMVSPNALSRSSRNRWQGFDSLRSPSGLPPAVYLRFAPVPSLPNPTFPARCPLSPRRAPPLPVNIASRRMSGFLLFGILATLDLCNEADSGSPCATARRFDPQGFSTSVTLGTACFSTCWIFSWHGEHLSVHWFGLAVLAHRISRIPRWPSVRGRVPPSVGTGTKPLMGGSKPARLP